jgi:hypothetical protein
LSPIWDVCWFIQLPDFSLFAPPFVCGYRVTCPWALLITEIQNTEPPFRNIVASIRHPWRCECPFRAMRKNINQFLTVATLEVRNAKKTGGVYRNLHLTGVSSEAVGFVLVRLARICLQSPWSCFDI